MSLAANLRAGETVFTAWSGIPDAVTVEAVAATGFGAVTLDMQHGGHHEDSVLRGLAPVISAQKHAIVRIPVGRFDMASRALDFGAEAVIAPMVNSVEDASAFARSMKYPPLGSRSWGPVFAMPRHGTADSAAWLEGQNEATLSLAMIETRQALDALDGILAVPGIDGVFVGPSDFSIAWTEGRAVDPALPEMVATLEDIARRAADAGKLAAIYLVDPKLAPSYRRMGYRLIALGSDQRYIAMGAKALLDAAME
ncbi:aldolase/citrate lyase family protein [Mesorhizobium sp. YIM 152430]|uniref:HpcH/HpaI aldolase family protein n=1 Tax=Mesorhizobium sp. YIM 152430 TaxID=3031761 RepID=UPI0023DB1F91|nr:aldolase/citrate lyase family protein [Mesorhizobium sp. YIM 152430]MDF1599810.1 aldolase/citrate lyase family protein [Mesorhizobium sp. YIM 152430]